MEVTRAPGSLPASLLAWLLCAAFLVQWAGCRDSTVAVSPPEPPVLQADPEPHAPPDAEGVAAASAGPPVVAPAAKLRLIAPVEPPPRGSATLTVTLDGKPAAGPLRAETLEEAHEGVAILLVVGARRAPAVPLTACKAALDTLGARDRVAVGAITARGFSLVYEFSADFQGARAALEQLQGTERGTAPEDPPALYRGIHASLDAFRARRALPALRAVVILTGGADPHMRRTSLRLRSSADVRIRSAYHRAPIHVIGYGDDGPALETIERLATQTGGSFRVVPSSGEGSSSAAADAGRALGRLLHGWSVVDATVSLDQGATARTVVLSAGDPAKTRSFSSDFGMPAALPERMPIVLGLPEPPPPVQPLGSEGRDVVAEAALAETSEQYVRAGALWHLARRMVPATREALDGASRVEAILRKRGLHRGTVLLDGRAVPIDVPVRPAAGVLQRIWSEDLQIQAPIEGVIRRREAGPGAEEETAGGPRGDPPVKHIVLHRCDAWTAEACARRLLVEGTATHIFVDPAGNVTQLADLSQVIEQPDVEVAAEALSIHLSLPPVGAPLFQSLDHPETWRHTRRLSPATMVNDERRRFWDLTPAQYEALVPLLRGLVTIHAALRPVLPIDLERVETPQALLHPRRFSGVLLHSNLSRAVSSCPGGGLRLGYLNATLPRWTRHASSADMETWIDDLASPGRAEGAVSRFGEVGPAAVPLLAEIAAELGPPERLAAMQALAATGAPAAAPVLVRFLETPEGPAAGEAATSIPLLALDGLARVGTRAELPAVAKLLRRLLGEVPETGAEASLELLLHTALAAVAALSAEPEDLEPLLPLLASPDARLRATAAATVALRGGSRAEQLLGPLAGDADPTIRLLAARSLGRGCVPAVVALAGEVGVERAVRELVACSPDAAVPEVVDLWDRADVVGRYALSDALVRWRHDPAVRKLAPRLAQAAASERSVLLRTLRGITGRDLGGAPDEWLRWRPAPPRK